MVGLEMLLGMNRILSLLLLYRTWTLTKAVVRDTQLDLEGVGV